MKTGIKIGSICEIIEPCYSGDAFQVGKKVRIVDTFKKTNGFLWIAVPIWTRAKPYVRLSFDEYELKLIK